MSPEKLNREVLRSIKLWDPYVFDRKVPLLTTQQRSGGGNNNNHSNNNYSKSNESNKAELNVDDDNAMEEELSGLDEQKKKDKRPFHKVGRF